VAKTVVYIMGAGRSGTTLLDIVLGNSDDAVSCGELNRFPRHRGHPPLVEPESPRGTFWKEVRAKLAYRDFERLTVLEHRHAYHSSALRTLAGIGDDAESAQYLAYIRDLYECLFEVSGATTLIDSSKYPGRALRVHQALAGTRIRVVYIYLRRDPVDVVRSFAKQGIEQPSKSWLAANAYYAVVNGLCRLAAWSLARSGRKVVAVSYEHLLTDPRAAVRAIAQALDLDAAGVERCLAANEFRVGPLFHGNRIRLKRTIQLESHRETRRLTWREKMTRWLNRPFYAARPES
jgi:Sulfotransferase family